MGRTERLSQPKQFGKYELVARLAPGSMGDVYKAKSHGLEGFEKILCVRVIHPGLAANPDFINTLIAEAQKITALAHANIAQVYDLGLEESTSQFYVAGEYIAGFDLARTLAVRRESGVPQPPALSVFIASEVAKALDYAHRRKDYNFQNLNIVHRHLTPHNIMLSFEGEVKVTDFGLSAARAFGSLGGDWEMHDMLYSAPEVIAGHPKTQQGDVFSLGLVLYEMLCGGHPYSAATTQEIHQLAAAARITPLGELVDLPRQLTSIVDSMLVPDPAGRAPSAGAVYEDLVAFIFGNNLRADSRFLAGAMQEVRRHESRVQPDQTKAEVGVDEISLSELKVIQERSDPSIGAYDPSKQVGDLPPSGNFEAMGNERPSLPGSLEQYYNSARSGRGKAVLVDGPLGAGRAYLPDRIVDALGWRGNTRAFAIQTTADDTYIPFRALTDIILETLETPADPESGIRVLQEKGADPEIIGAFRSVVGHARPGEIGKARRRRRLAELALFVLRDATREGPLVISIDRVERLDQLSLDAIRALIGHINEMSLMLVMCTSAAELMRSSFDIGRPESLEAVRVVGDEPPSIDTIEGLDDNERALLLVVALAGRPMSSADLRAVTGFDDATLDKYLRRLADRGCLRVPAQGWVVTGLDDMVSWARETFLRSEIQAWAGAVARFYQTRAAASSLPTQWGPVLTRLNAYAGERRATLAEARGYASWLQNDGWIHAALHFYEFVANAVSENRLGSPQARVEFLLQRAELALELSQVDVCRATLQPVNALSEAARNERGAIRAQIMLGQLALQQDDLEEALRHLRRAANAARSGHDPDLLAYSLLGLARWYDRFGDVVAAQRYLESAMNLYNRWGTFRLDLNARALLLNRAVRTLSRRGLRPLAKRMLADLLGLAQHTGLPMALCRADWAQAAMDVADERYDDAREALRRADARAEEHGLVALRLELLRERAVAALSAADYVEVVQLSDQLLIVAREHQDMYSEQRAGDLRATAHCLLNQDVESALHHLRSSLRRATDRDVPKDVYRCHLNLDRALSATGDTRGAQRHRQAADEIAVRMRYHVN